MASFQISVIIHLLVGYLILWDIANAANSNTKNNHTITNTHTKLLTLREILWEIKEQIENALKIALPKIIAQMLDGLKFETRKLDWTIKTGCLFIGDLRWMFHSDITNSSAV